MNPRCSDVDRMDIHNYRQFWMSRIGLSYIISSMCLGMTMALTESVQTVYLLGVGFTFTQIGVIWSTSLGTGAVLDFPTGNMSDKLGRKTVYCTGLLSIAAGHFLFSLSLSFFFFLVGALFLGFGAAQISGTLAAWMVEEKKKQGKSKDIAKVFGDSQLVVSLSGIIVGFLIGGLYRGPLQYLFLLSAGVLTLSCVWVWGSLEENYGHQMGWLDFQKKTLRHYWKTKLLILLSVNMVLTFSCYTIFIFVYQPTAVASGIENQQLGVLFAFYLIAAGASGFIFGRLSSKVPFHFLLLVSFTAIGGGFWLFTVKNIYVITGGVVLFSVGYGGCKPVIGAWTHSLIPDGIRASTISLASTISRGSVFLLQPVVGTLIDTYSLLAAIILGEVFCLLGVVLYVIIKKESQRVSPLTEVIT